MINRIINRKSLFFLAIFVLMIVVTVCVAPILTPDSEAYITGAKERALLYPVLLRGFNYILGEAYLKFVAVFQTVLWAVGIAFFSESFIELLGTKKTVHVLAIYFITCFQLIGLSLQDKRWYPAVILTEGLAYPLFLISIGFLLRYLYIKATAINEIASILAAILCAFLRKQMFFVLALETLVYIFVSLLGAKEKNHRNSIMDRGGAAVVAVALTISSVFLYGSMTNKYNEYFGNENALTSYDVAMFGNYFFYASENDVDSLEDKDKDLFNFAYDSYKDIGYLYSDYRSENSEFATSIQRNSKYDSTWGAFLPLITDYVNKISEKNDSNVTVEQTLSSMGRIEATVVKNHWFEIIIGLIMRCVIGVVNTVSHSITSYNYKMWLFHFTPAMIFYIAFIAGGVVNRKNKTVASATVLTALFVVGNAASVSLFIMPNFRYMLYYFPLCYCVLYMQIFKWIEARGNADNILEKEWNILDKFIASIRYAQIDRYFTPNSVICDIGCGRTGNLLYRYKDRIIRGVGFDFRQMNHTDGNLEFINNRGAKDLKLTPYSFDIVFMIAVLEHLDDSNKMFEDISAICNDGGKVVITTPTRLAKPILEFMAFRLHIISEAEIAEHKHYYDESEINKLYTENGLTMTKYKKFWFGLNSVAVGVKNSV